MKPSFRDAFLVLPIGSMRLVYLPTYNYHKNQTNRGSYWLVLASKHSHLPWDEIFGKCIDGACMPGELTSEDPSPRYSPVVQAQILLAKVASLIFVPLYWLFNRDPYFHQCFQFMVYEIIPKKPGKDGLSSPTFTSWWFQPI